MAEEPKPLELLVKLFQEKQHADEFRKGNLYANPLSYFQKMEKKDGIADPFEGSVYSGKDSIFKIGPSQGELVDITPHLIGPVRLQRVNHVNVICFHLWKTPFFQSNNAIPLDNPIETEIEIPRRIQDEFGPYMILIHNTAEFIDRVEKEIRKQYIANKFYKCMHGMVAYKDNFPISWEEQSAMHSAFYKREKYAYQNEYRIAIELTNITKKGGSPLRFNIGSLEDITNEYMSNTKLILQASQKPIV